MTFCTYDSTIQQKFNMHICDHTLGKGNPLFHTYLIVIVLIVPGAYCYSVQNHNHCSVDS